MRIVPLSLALAMISGCAVEPAVAPAPVVAVEPVPVTLVACNLNALVGPCYDDVLGYYYAPPGVAVVGWYPAPPVGYVAPFGVSVGIGFGGGAVVNNTIVNNTVVNNVSHTAAPASAVGAGAMHPSFAAAHPGFMTAMKNVGHAAAVGAKAAGHVAVASAKVAGNVAAAKSGRPVPVR